MSQLDGLAGAKYDDLSLIPGPTWLKKSNCHTWSSDLCTCYMAYPSPNDTYINRYTYTNTYRYAHIHKYIHANT